MKSVGFYTLGCKVNQYESEAMSSLFEKGGYKIVDFNERADVYVINTCTVTNLSDRKSRQIIRKSKKNNPEAIIVATGCYAQTAPDELDQIPEIDLIIGTKNRKDILKYIEKILATKTKLNVVEDIMKAKIFEEFDSSVHVERTRAYVKIQEGCTQYCTYCIIPYARGPVRSRDIENIYTEVLELANKGFKEIVITGIHIGSYGKDKEGITLLDVILKIHEIDGIDRIRLGSLEPTMITENFVNSIKHLNKICPHFHLSLQSGCDKTLKRMNRKYNTLDFENATKILKNNIEDVALTTDIIVGFPGETDEDFKESINFVEKIGFSKVHVFKYSPRKGTPAAAYKDQIPSSKKEERSNSLITLSDRKSEEFNTQFINREMLVLFEQQCKDKEGYIEGLTPNYIKVVAKSDHNLIGNICRVKITNAFKEYVEGEVIILKQ